MWVDLMALDISVEDWEAGSASLGVLGGTGSGSSLTQEQSGRAAETVYLGKKGCAGISGPCPPSFGPD
jgi:dihydrodipicolinate synthase/N-acetylneuraminate lyase